MGKAKDVLFVKWQALCDGAVTDKAFDLRAVNSREKQSDAVVRLKHALNMKSWKIEIEGTPSAILVIKTTRYDCCSVSPIKFIFMTIKWASLSIFSVNSAKSEFVNKEKIEF